MKDDLLRKLSSQTDHDRGSAGGVVAESHGGTRTQAEVREVVVQVSRFWQPLDKPLGQIATPDAKQLYAEHVARPCPRTKKPPSAATHHEQLL